jgi:hypothetical protein
VILLAVIVALLPGVAPLADVESASGTSIDDAMRRATSLYRSPGMAAQLLADDEEAVPPEYPRSYRERDRHLLRDLGNAGKYLAEDLGYFYSAPARIDKTSALWLGGILAVGGVIYAYDQEIYEEVKRNEEHGLLKPFIEISEEIETLGYGGTNTKMYTVALLAGYVSGWDKLEAIAIDLWESYIIAGTMKNVANFAMGRARPNDQRGPYFFKHNQGTSLPSGHTSNIIQMARILEYHIDFWPFTVVAYTGAGTIALERISSGNHWASDVYIALIYAWLVADRVVERNERRRLLITPTTVGDGSSPGLGLTWRF